MLLHVEISKMIIYLLNIINMYAQIIVEVIKMVKNIYGINKMVKNSAHLEE